jgi:nicotinamidase-related amidase
MAGVTLVVDMLNDDIQPEGALFVEGGPGIVPAVQREAERAREKGGTVIYICDAHDPGDPEFQRYPPHCVAGTSGALIIEELAPRPGDLVVHKKDVRPFYRTLLGDILERLNPDRATVTGLATHICVMEAVATCPKDFENVQPDPYSALVPG